MSLANDSNGANYTGAGRCTVCSCVLVRFVFDKLPFCPTSTRFLLLKLFLLLSSLPFRVGYLMAGLHILAIVISLDR